MRILLVSDVEDRYLWSIGLDDRPHVDLILSCGDLDSDYLQYLVSMFNCPLLYVHGNHDDNYETNPPLGCTCIEDTVYNCKGLRILGLGGSLRYKEGANMYNEAEMTVKYMKAWLSIRANKGFDILLTHAPALGTGDMDDLPHRGFNVFNILIRRYNPIYHVYGHVHKAYISDFKRVQTLENGTIAVNAWGKYLIDIPSLPGLKTDVISRMHD